jgi:alkylation response protein AidB-like acyl-CoA dehydrogenase
MDLELTDDQKALVDAVSSLVQRHLAIPREGNVAAVVHQHYSTALDGALTEGGFFGIARETGYGPLEAVLLLEEVYRSPSVVEIAASAIVAPQLVAEELPRPIVLLRGNELDRATRFLGIARTALVDLGEQAAVMAIAPEEVEQVGAIYAYPYGRFKQPPNLAKAKRLGPGSGAKLRNWWRVALTAEIGAATMQAVLSTSDYVKNRRQFGRQIGSFQGVQHRLAVDIQIAESMRWLARRAAWSGNEADAAAAALYAQESIGPVAYDCHQFNGALGMTLEHPLHFWTLRMRALQGEMGGPAAHTDTILRTAWGVGAA